MNYKMPIIRVGHVREGVVGLKVDRKTVLGNPFTEHNSAGRDDAIEKYRHYLNQKVKYQDREVCLKLTELKNLALQKGELTLLCWCRKTTEQEPACHADVIRRCLEWMIREDADLVTEELFEESILEKNELLGRAKGYRRTGEMTRYEAVRKVFEEANLYNPQLFRDVVVMLKEEEEERKAS